MSAYYDNSFRRVTQLKCIECEGREACALVVAVRAYKVCHHREHPCSPTGCDSLSQLNILRLLILP
jgi:hypothetical protein